jgi:hypothetical protein
LILAAAEELIGRLSHFSENEHEANSNRESPLHNQDCVTMTASKVIARRACPMSRSGVLKHFDELW